MKAFLLIRTEDLTGVSGTGIVAEGVEWDDGSCSVRWLGEWPTVQHHDRGIESVLHIHGHNGATRVAWQIEPATPTVTGAP